MKNITGLIIILVGVVNFNSLVAATNYKGKWVEGTGDKQKLELIEQAFESTQVSAQMTSLAMRFR